MADRHAIRRDALGGVRFADPEIERAYNSQAVRKSLDQSRYTPLVAAFLFLVSVPMDIALIGDGRLTPLVWHCLLARGVWIALLVTSGLLQGRMTVVLKSISLIFGWYGSVLVLWYISVLAPPEAVKFYFLTFGLAALSTTTLLPAFNHWQIRAMNATLAIPVAERCFACLPVLPHPEDWQFLLALFFTVSMTFFGLYAKRSYEIALRADYALREELALARDAALAADRAKSDFLSAASHDMRTPLNAILGNIQLLRRTAPRAEDARALLGDAEAASRTLTQLVEGVLHAARGAAQEPSKEDVDLEALLEEIRANTQSLADQKGLDLVFEVRGSRSEIRTDPRLILQVLLNLMSNAIKFTQRGKVGLRMRVSGGTLRVLVSDTGVGMPSVQASKPPQRFVRGSAAPRRDSFGLGLAIAYDLVGVLGGRIRIHSRAGRGTVVAAAIPVAEAAGTGRAQKADAAGPLPRLRVLVVEDEALNIAVLDRMLSHLGQTQVVARTAAEALEVYAKQDFDCVLCDIQLPDMSGLDLLCAFMALPKSSGEDAPPIFAVTANALPEDIERYDAAGFDGVLAKPIEVEGLAALLEGVAASRPFVDPRVSVEEAAASVDLRRLYQESFAQGVQDIRGGLAAQDRARVSKAAHRLRGAALYAGDAQTAELARVIERFAQSEDADWAKSVSATAATLCASADEASTSRGFR